MLYESIFSVRGEPKAHGQWCSNRILLNDINGNHSRALPWAVPVQHRGKILLYHFVSSNEDVPGLKFTGWDEVVMLGISKKVPLSGEVRLGSSAWRSHIA